MALPTNIEQKVFALIDYFHRKKYLAYIEELERKDAFKEKRTRSIEKRARVKTTQLLKEHVIVKKKNYGQRKGR